MEINKIQTRAQREQARTYTKNEAENENAIPKNHPNKKEMDYYIEENKNLLVKNDEHDQIFYIFSNVNCRMHKQLQHKLKTELKITPNTKTNIFYVGNKRVVILSNNKNVLSDQTKNYEDMITKIKSISVDNLYQNIAINVEFANAQHLFEFKTLIRRHFCSTQIKVNIYLNRVIEITDPDQIQKILNEYHNSAWAGHNSFEKTKNSIKKYFHWYNLNSDIKNHIKNCDLCEKNKVGRHTKNPMQISSTANKPFEKVVVDIIGEIFPHSEKNHKYIFVIVDDLTKWTIGIPIKDCTSLTIAHTFITNVVLKYGPPKILVSDNASYFSSELIAQMTRLLKTKKFFTTAYRPQGSICERVNKEIGKYLRTYVQKEKEQWHVYIDYAIYSHNTTPSTVTGFTPFELLFAHEPNMPLEILRRDVPIYNYEDYIAQIRSKLRTYHLLAKEKYEERKHQNKKNYDKNRNEKTLDLKINDLV